MKERLLEITGQYILRIQNKSKKLSFLFFFFLKNQVIINHPNPCLCMTCLFIFSLNPYTKIIAKELFLIGFYRSIYKVCKIHLTMANISVTKMSSKGQIVIPSSMRENLKEGDEILIIKDEDRIILKKADKLTEEMKEDLEFAKRTEEAYQRIEAGEGIKMDFDDFISEMKKW